MATRHRDIYLYLTLACFLGLIAIFIVDGYMGVYDTVYLTTGEREQKIEADAWRYGTNYWPAGVNRDEKTFFRYEIDNRRFAAYSANIEVSVWRSQEKISDLGTYPVVINAFGKQEITWTVDAAEILLPEALPEQRYEYTVRIKRAEIERNIILIISPAVYPESIKPIPVPPVPVR